MRLQLSDEDVAFREEMREFFTTKVSKEIRDTVAARHELTKEQIVEAQQTLNAAGHRRAQLAGRVGRQGLDAPAAPHLARRDAARQRADPAGVQRLDGRACHRGLRLAGAQGTLPAPRPPTSTSGGRRDSPSRTPAPTSPRCAPPRSRKATSTSSTARRRGRRSASTATGSSTWSAPIPTPRSRLASRSC